MRFFIKLNNFFLFFNRSINEAVLERRKPFFAAEGRGDRSSFIKASLARLADLVRQTDFISTTISFV